MFWVNAYGGDGELVKAHLAKNRTIVIVNDKRKSPLGSCLTSLNIPAPRWGRARVGVKKAPDIHKVLSFLPPLYPLPPGEGAGVLTASAGSS